MPDVPIRPRPNQWCYLHLWCRFSNLSKLFTVVLFSLLKQVPLNLEFLLLQLSRLQDCEIYCLPKSKSCQSGCTLMPYINVPNQKEKSTCFLFQRIIKGLVPCIRHSEAFDDSPTSQSIFRDASPFLIVLLSLVVYNRSPFWYSLLVLCQRIYMRQLSKESV